MVKFLADSKEKIQTIQDKDGGLAILDFYWKTSDKCKKLDPFAEQLNMEKNIPLIKIDVNDAKDLCICYSYNGIPSFAVVKEKWGQCRRVQKL
jgi:thiol-disulfide isomerase/thioredoxin